MLESLELEGGVGTAQGRCGELNTGPASEETPTPQLSAAVWDPGVVMEP